MKKRKKSVWFIAFLIVNHIGIFTFIWLSRSSDGFLGLDLDPVRVAGAETRMWKAYYKGDVETLKGEILILLKEDFGFSHEDAVEVSQSLGRAALVFHMPVPGSEKAILTDLEKAYGKLRDLTEGSWDSSEAARAELKWWRDRRTPERSDVETVGRSISGLYTILTGKDNANIQRAGLFRARAANLRDSGGDWAEVERLLVESYRAFLDGAVE